MTDKQKIERLETLGWDMYHAAQNLNTDASSLHKTMNKWWLFVNHELNEEEPVSESLEEAAREAATWHSRINGNQFFPNDYNKFIAGAQWADEHPKNLWKDACGTDLPEIDREVIALLTNGKVVFAHRPPERWYGRNMDGEESVFYPKTYDEGEWNQPDVKWWLDIELPKMEE